MLSRNRWLSLSTGIFLAAAIAGCGESVSGSGGGSGGQTSSGGGGAGGSTASGGATSSGGSTASGGSGGAPQALADQGVVQSDCAPNDGAAISLDVGTASVCNDSPNSAPQARFLAYPATMDSLATGMTWDTATGLSAWFYPNGTVAAEVIADTAHIEVLDVTAADVRFSYSFTANGVKYGGTATLLICQNTPLCG